MKQIVLEWKGSGSKLSFTKVQPVNSAGMVVFDETLNMVCSASTISGNVPSNVPSMSTHVYLESNHAFFADDYFI